MEGDGVEGEGYRERGYRERVGQQDITVPCTPPRTGSWGTDHLISSVMCHADSGTIHTPELTLATP